MSKHQELFSEFSRTNENFAQLFRELEEFLRNFQVRFQRYMGERESHFELLGPTIENETSFNVELIYRFGNPDGAPYFEDHVPLICSKQNTDWTIQILGDGGAFQDLDQFMDHLFEHLKKQCKRAPHFPKKRHADIF